MNYEGIQQSVGVTRIATVPNCPAACPVTAPGATGALIQQILNIFPKPDPGTVAPGSVTGFSTQVVSRRSHEHYILGRFDANFSSTDSLFIRYISDKAIANDPFGGSFNAATLPFWPELDNSHAHFATIEERHIFSPSLLNVGRITFSRPEQDALTTGSTPALRFPGYEAREDGAVTISGLSPIGASTATPFVAVPARQIQFGLRLTF